MAALGVGLLSLAGCLSADPQVTGLPEVPQVPPVPQGAQRPMVLCRIELVARPPPGAQTVGVLDIPGEQGEDLVLDEGARRQACALGATHGVQEEAHLHTNGLYWRVRLYRDIPGPPQESGEVSPRERVEEAQPEPIPGLPEGGRGPQDGRGPF